MVSRPTFSPPTPEGALRALFSTEPSQEEKAAGLNSWFSPRTADLLISARVADGIGYVNLRDFTFLNNVSTTCGGAGFRSQIETTLAPFGLGQTDPGQGPESFLRLAIEGDPQAAADLFQLECQEPCDPAAFRS